MYVELNKEKYEHRKKLFEINNEAKLFYYKNLLINGANKFSKSPTTVLPEVNSKPQLVLLFWFRKEHWHTIRRRKRFKGGKSSFD